MHNKVLSKMINTPDITERLIVDKSASIRKDKALLNWGYFFLGISSIGYAIEELKMSDQQNENLTIFFLHYFIAIAYSAVLIWGGSFGIRKSWKKEHIHKTVILLNLFLISAYALNRNIPVFEDSVEWFCGYLILMSSTLLSFRFYDRLPSIINRIQELLLGSALVLYIYLALFVANFYPVGAIGTILFGIGAHVLVPLFLLIGALSLLIHVASKRIALYWTVGGVFLTLCYVLGFVVEWNIRIKNVERTVNQAVLENQSELPLWAKIGESINTDWITKRMLKSDIVYSVSNDDLNWNFLPSRNWDEQRKHDPLVFLASLTRKTSLSEEGRIHILQAITDSRHKTEERLWSGENLTTSYVVTDVDIFPELRIAYTEQYFNIKNNDTRNNRWWANNEEAIYLFQLPEGSVVTSLSLWVNGKEEKGILTSKQKATEAYTTIVGKEMRDPSVVHWQEGNTVSVRVFPCTKDEERKFKIGITSPLPVIDKKLVYRNITFRGPNASDANQTMRIRFIGNGANVEAPRYLARNANGELFGETEYDNNFQISMDATPIKENHFSFDGFTYSLKPYVPENQYADFQQIYLDINNSWKKKELEDIKKFLNTHSIYVFPNESKVKLTDENWSELTNALLARNFSLFPFHKLDDPSHSLVVTKGKELSPFLIDLKESAFANAISSFFESGNKVSVYNLEGSSSTYIRSLRELRGFTFSHGNSTQLVAALDQKQFPVSHESEERIILHDAQLVIEKKPSIEPIPRNTAPDHLARLFAYNNIMRQIGADFFKNDFVNEKLVDEAATAYVVSPVSSLIVLETKEDYERFDIKDKENSLHNAMKQSSGAVPEPHEWALIILFLAFVLISVFRKYNRFVRA